MAAGQDLEPYWEVYRQHFRGQYVWSICAPGGFVSLQALFDSLVHLFLLVFFSVVDWMEKYRIGNLSPEDAVKARTSITFGDMYDTDPERDPDLLHWYVAFLTAHREILRPVRL